MLTTFSHIDNNLFPWANCNLHVSPTPQADENSVQCSDSTSVHTEHVTWLLTTCVWVVEWIAAIARE